MMSVDMHMGLATVHSRRDSDVSPKEAPSGDSSVFLLSVSTGSLNFCKGHCDTTRIGTFVFSTISFASNCSFTCFPH
jgi:hypothetical protein